MKSRTLYACEICGTDYADKERCQKCEKGHQKVKDVKPYYKGIYCADMCGLPYKLDVTFENGTVATYKR